MTGPKLNEQPVLRRRPESKARAVEGEVRSARAVARYIRVSPYKVREVLDLVRGQSAERASEILRFCERDAATVVGKALASAVANAEQNLQVLPDELYVSSCFADEGPTLKRWRPRARGRATRIRKRTCHVTVIVSRLPDHELTDRRSRAGGTDRRRRRAGQEAADRRRRTGASKDADATATTTEATTAAGDEPVTPETPSAPDTTAAPEPNPPSPSTTEPAEGDPADVDGPDPDGGGDDQAQPPDAAGQEPAEGDPADVESGNEEKGS